MMNSPPPNPPLRRRRWPRRLALVAAGATLVAASGYLFRETLVHPWLPSVVEWIVEERWDVDLELERVEGDWFGAMRLHGIAIRSAGGPPPGSWSLEVATLDVLHERGSLRSTEAHGVRVFVDASGRREGGGAPVRFPERMPSLRVEDAELDLVLTEALSVRVRGAGMSVAAEGSQQAVDVHAREVAVAGSATWSGPGEFRGSYGDGRLDVDHLMLGPGPGASRFEAGGVRLELADLLARQAPTRGELIFAVDDVSAFLGGDPLEAPAAHRARLRGSLTRDGVEVSEGRLSGPGGTLSLERGSVTRLSGKGPRLEVAARADLDDLAALEDLLRAEGPWGGALSGSLSLSGFWPEVSGVLDLGGSGLLVDGAALGDLTVAANVGLDVTRPGEVEGDVSFEVGPLLVGGWRLDQLEGAVRADTNGFAAENLALVQGVNRVDVAELRWPRSFSPTAILAGATGDLRVEVADLPTALGRPRPAGSTPAHRLILTGSVAGGRAAVNEGELVTEGGVARVRSGELVIGTADDGETTVATSLDLFAEFTELAAFGPLLGTDTWNGDLRGDVFVTGTWPDLAAKLELDGTDVAVAGLDLGRVAVSASVDRAGARVERALLERDQDRIRASGEVDFESLALADVELSARITDLGSWARGPFEGRLMAGTLELDGQLAGTWPRLSGDLSMALSELRSNELPVEHLSVQVVAADDRYAVETLELGGAWGDLRARGEVAPGEANAWSARIEALELSADSRTLALEAPAVLLFAPGEVRTERLVLGGSAGRLAAGLNVGTERTRVQVEARDLQIGEAFAATWLPGLAGMHGADAELDVIRTGTGLTFMTSGRIGELRLADPAPALGVAWHAEHVDGRLAVRDLTVTLDDGSELRAHGSAPLAPFDPQPFPDGDLDLRLEASVVALERLPWLRAGEGQPMEGEGRLEAALSGTWRSPAGDVRFVAGRVRLPEVDESGELRLHATLADAIRIEEAVFDVPERLYIEAAGALDVPTDPAAWLRADADVLAAATVDAALKLDVEQLTWIAPRFQSIRRVAGTARGHARVSGPLLAPELAGELSVGDGELKLASEIPAMSGVELRLDLAGRDLVVREMRGELGGAPFLMEGSIGLGGEQPELDLRLAGENLLLRRERGVLVRADSDLKVTGPLDGLNVLGDLRLRGPRITRDVDLLGFGKSDGRATDAGPGIRLFAFTQPPLASASFDVRITSEEPVEIRNNVARGELRPDLSLRGTGDAPAIEGVLQVGPTTVALPASRLRFESGVITVDGRAPAVPEVNLVGKARKLGYDVSVVVTGPYDAPEVRLSSSPPLASEDILLLLLAGQPPAESPTGRSAVDAGRTVAVYLAEDVLSGWLTGDALESGEESLLDRFEVVTGRDVSESGVPTAEVSFRLAEDWIATGDRVLLTMERDRYEHYGIGVRLVFKIR